MINSKNRIDYQELLPFFITISNIFFFTHFCFSPVYCFIDFLWPFQLFFFISYFRFSSMYCFCQMSRILGMWAGPSTYQKRSSDSPELAFAFQTHNQIHSKLIEAECIYRPFGIFLAALFPFSIFSSLWYWLGVHASNGCCEMLRHRRWSVAHARRTEDGSHSPWCWT